MFHWLKRRSTLDRAATRLYGSVVAQARLPNFYSKFGVPDTAEGRYEMIVVHLFTLIERLGSVPDGTEVAEAADELSTALTSVFVTDMDDNFREMGVGDLSVPRKVKKAAAGLYDRTLEYRKGVAAGRQSAVLSSALAANCGVGVAEPDGEALAGYVYEVLDHLAAQHVDSLLSGAVSFPQPRQGA